MPKEKSCQIASDGNKLDVPQSREQRWLGNLASAVGTEVNSGDIVPAWGLVRTRIEWGSERGVFRGRHPQSLSLEGNG